MFEPIPVSAVLLAAGASRRFGVDNKLLAHVGGRPLVAISAERLVAAGLARIVAVVASGPDGDAVASAMSDLPVDIVVNADAHLGIGTSIARGAAALEGTEGGTLILPADMPSVDAALLKALIAAFRENGGRAIVHPVTQSGKQRNPVIWPVWLRPDLTRLDGDAGGKPMLAAHREHVVTISSESDQGFEDIDTPDDLARILANRG